MLNLEVTFPSNDFDIVIKLIISMGSEIGLLSWSSDEGGGRRPLVHWRDVQGEILSRGGFVWVGDDFIEIIPSSPKGGATLFSATGNLRIVDLVVNASKRHDAIFGYICEENERKHRNMVTREMNYGKHQSWVGRDFHRYLPGLYWVTLLSKDLMEKLNINIDAIRHIATNVELYKNKLWTVHMYNDPSDWCDKATDVDNWCASTPGCFSVLNAIKDLDSAKSFLEAANVARKWP